MAAANTRKLAVQAQIAVMRMDQHMQLDCRSCSYCMSGSRRCSLADYSARRIEHIAEDCRSDVQRLLVELRGDAAGRTIAGHIAPFVVIASDRRSYRRAAEQVHR